MPVGGIGHAGLRQQGVGDARVEARLEIAGDTPAEQFFGIVDNDRRGLDCANDDTRALPASGSISTAPMAWANSPVLRQLFT